MLITPTKPIPDAGHSRDFWAAYRTQRKAGATMLESFERATAIEYFGAPF